MGTNDPRAELPEQTFAKYYKEKQKERYDMQEYYGHPEFYRIVEELKELHSNKNRDYAGDDPLSNLKLCEMGGIPAWKGVIIRLTDKLSRLLTFTKREKYEIKDESIEDTFRDTAVYAILGLILYRETNKEDTT